MILKAKQKYKCTHTDFLRLRTPPSEPISVSEVLPPVKESMREMVNWLILRRRSEYCSSTENIQINIFHSTWQKERKLKNKSMKQPKFSNGFIGWHLEIPPPRLPQSKTPYSHHLRPPTPTTPRTPIPSSKSSTPPPFIPPSPPPLHHHHPRHSFVCSFDHYSTDRT